MKIAIFQNSNLERITMMTDIVLKSARHMGGNHDDRDISEFEYRNVNW